MDRNFEKWLSQFQTSIANWEYYTDFNKVYCNANKIKEELNLLNRLIGSQTIEKDFKELVDKNPKVLKVIPRLIAKRDNKIRIRDAEKDEQFDFCNQNLPIEDYIKFMRKTGIFTLIESGVIGNLYDYVIGIEVGLDSNARKNRTGRAMEDLVESYIKKAGFNKDVNYYKEITTKEIKERWKIDLVKIEDKLQEISKNKKAEKRFDFAIKTQEQLYVIETNFYASIGSKLNETARSYKMIQEEIQKVNGVTFVWFTDGKGWNQAKNNLKETFDQMEHIYNIADMKNNIMTDIFK